jgi:hypothetical protein
MSETFQPSLYQTETDGEAAGSGKPPHGNGRFSGRVAASNALEALLGYLRADNASLLCFRQRIAQLSAV